MKHHAFRLVVAGIVLATSAVSARPGHPAVDFRPDGTVVVGTRVFATREAYHRSGVFRASGARCGTPERQPPVMELISPGDCGRSSTTIKPDYNDNRTLVIPVVF